MQDNTNNNSDNTNNPNSANKYIVPLSIVIAGIIIAGAIFMTRQSNNAPVAAATNTANQASDVNTVLAIRPIDQAADHILGNPNAPVQIVEYSDAQCPYCRQFDKTMQQVMATYGSDSKVAWVYREFPLDSLHPDAHRRADALECAASIGGNAKFWTFLHTLFAISDTVNAATPPPDLGAMAKSSGIDETKFNTCLDTKTLDGNVAKDEQDAVNAGGHGTPFNVLVMQNGVTDAAKAAVTALQTKYGAQGTSIVYVSDDGKKIAVGGALPIEDIQSILDAQLK